jgi:hypothetical protein
MATLIQKYAGSIRFWILVVVSAYLAYALYFAIYGLNFSLYLITNQYVYGLVSQDPWWWQILYYGSEGVAGSVAIVLRAVAGVFAFYAAFLYWRNKPDSMPKIRKTASTALLCEAGFFLAPMLLKLRSAVKREASEQEISKWGSLTGVSYLFAVFWFNYGMLWAANMVPYPQAYAVSGLDFLLQPTNLLSFAITVFGLLAVSLAALAVTFPAIKKGVVQFDFAKIGVVMVAFGGYFLFHVVYYYVTGGYEAHPSVWYEVISPMHNPNLWALAFIFLGVPLIVKGWANGVDVAKKRNG